MTVVAERSREKAQGYLPSPATRFVGRRREIAEIRGLMGRSRLVTLTGVGGAGKTRLAIEVATRLRAGFPGGAWMIDLAAVTDENAVPQEIVNALGIADRSPMPAVDKVAAFLGDAQALLVVDNCEHLFAESAAFADELLARASHVRILATSRRALGIAGEHLFEVPPLSVPDRPEMVSPEALGQYDAVTLLVDRTTAFRPSFKITEENAPSVARLCAQFDGLPLAIELAASKLRSLSPEQLADRMQRQFAVLTSGNAGALPRQQTLQAVFDWSYSLCSDPERLLWARLSVFAGTFDLAAAEGVCAGPDLPEQRILDLLDRLVTQSIVMAKDTGGEIRFRLLETIRQYGRERLADAGEEQILRLRHRDYYLGRAQRLAAAWCGPAQAAVLATMRAEHGNLRAAFEASVTDPAGPAAALALAQALRHHWYVDGFLAEGRDWLDQALSLPAQADADRVGALWVAAWVCLLQGDGPAGLARLDECDRLAAALGDRRAAGFSRSLRGTAELFIAKVPDAIASFEDARATFDEIGDTEGLLWVLFQLAISRAHLGETERARAICQESVKISEAIGERLLRAYALWVHGFETWLRGEPEAAAIEHQALAIEREFSDPVGTALIIEVLAWIAAERGDPELAARMLATAASVWSLIGTTIAAFGPSLGVHRAECEARVDLALGERGLAAAVRKYRYGSVEAAIGAVLDEPSEARATAGESPLTPRESQIAALIAEGMSNRAIAERLVISPRTVDGHVERILAKLGFTSRAQVAAWAASESEPDHAKRITGLIVVPWCMSAAASFRSASE